MLQQWAAAVTRTVRRSQLAKISILFIWLLSMLFLYNHGTERTQWAREKLENQFNDMIEKVNDFQAAILEPPEEQEVGEEVLARAFHSGEVKQVILLSYNRCGSTFMGQIFNHNPAAFYMYEPIDAIYTAMYGTAQGWNVASDIFMYSNGTVRPLPQYEMDKVAEVLGNMLSCEFDDVPTEMFINHFWGLFITSHERLRPYKKCLNQQGVDGGECRNHLKVICAKRFGGDYGRLGTCRPYLMENKEYGPYVREFSMYQECLAKQRRKAGKCIRMMKDVCMNSAIRSTKTVRMNMEVGERLLRRYRNIRIIHLFRDPRAVALSRMSHTSFRGLGNQIVSEAGVYCEGVLRDVRLRKQLEVMFPGSTMQIIYEDFVSNPKSHLQLMYEFLNSTVTKPVSSWLEHNTEELKHNSSSIAAKWQEKVTYKVAKLIGEVCDDLFEEIKYRWP